MAARASFSDEYHATDSSSERMTRPRSRPRAAAAAALGAAAAAATAVVTKHQSDPPLKLLICSGNIGNAEPDLDSMQAWIPTKGKCGNVSLLRTKSFKKRIDEDAAGGGSGNNGNSQAANENVFDMIVIGMQEATWKNDASLDEDEIIERRFGLSSICGGSKSTSSGDDVDQDDIVLRQLIRQILGKNYRLQVEKQRGQMRLYIYVRSAIRKHISNVKVSCKNTGVGNIMANKGGIVCTMTYQATTLLSFCTAHLAAHEGDSYYDSRCQNIQDILKGTSSSSSTLLVKRSTKTSYDIAISSHHVFILGDLNFRTNFYDTPNADLDAKVERALHYIRKKEYSKLYQYDELVQGLRDRHFLIGFDTLSCQSFSPTFKVERCQGVKYQKERTPSYTDRILFKSSPGCQSNLHPRTYESCPGFTTSDHKPIRGAFDIIPNRSIPTITPKDDSPRRIIFRDLECKNLAALDVTSSDPYLKFVWDGCDLHVMEGGDRKGKSWLSKQMSKMSVSDRNGTTTTATNNAQDLSYPRTEVIPKDLNPRWKGAEISLLVPHKITAHARLLITVLDYDALSQNDLIGTTVFNLVDLLRKTAKNLEQPVLYDRSVLKYGVQQGTFRCSVTQCRL